ncbi:MAG: flagellar type III secretion system pore protein FliP, partial [Litorivicinus sp.]
MIRWLALLLIPLASVVQAEDLGVKAFTVTQNADGENEYSVTLQILAIMTALSFLPAIVMMMTAFTRIIVVLAILRQAIGLQQSPSNQILVGLAMFLTFFIMAPVFGQMNEVGLQPYLNETLGSVDALNAAIVPLKEFMLANTREVDLQLFSDMAGVAAFATNQDVPLQVLVPAFVTSELKTAFQIGFMLFIPFLVIDLVVASVLMAMGMMMLSPIIISLP